MGRKKMKGFITRLPIMILAALLISVSMGAAAYAQDHRVYWADTSGVKFSPYQITLSDSNPTETIRLMAKVDAPKTLQAFTLKLTYDAAIAAISDAVAVDGSGFTTVINPNTPGTITVTGFSVSGKKGPATVPVMDVKLKGVAQGTFNFGIGVETFGASASDQFVPQTEPLPVTVTTITAGPHEAFFANLSDERFADDTLNLAVGEEQTIRLRTEVPANMTLKAYNFTLPYNGIEVLSVTPVAGSVFAANTQINHAGISPVNFASFSTTGVATATSLLEIKIRGLNSGSFGITADKFGSDTVERKPLVSPLTINVTSVGQVYWEGVTVSAGNKLDNLNLAVGEEQTIKLTAGIPAGKTLKAYNFTLTYDPAKIEAAPTGGSTFTNSVVNSSTPGTIQVVGFDTTGIAGGSTAEVSVLDVKVKGKADGTSTFAITVNEFGSDAADQFKPTPSHLTIIVGAIANETYWVDAGTLVRFDTLSLAVGQEKTIRLIANTPGNKEVKAYKFTLKYDPAVVSAQAKKITDGGMSFDPNNILINDAQAGTIITNGFSTVGIGGNVYIIDVTLKGIKKGSFPFQITADKFGASSGDQFIPVQKDPKQNIAVTDVLTHIITATASQGGTITPSGAVLVNHGENITFVFVPNAGYQISGVQVNSVPQGLISMYTFTNVTADQKITVTFIPKIDQYVIVPSAGPNGTITPANPIYLDAGGSATFTFTPDANYRIEDVLVDDVSQGPIPMYTFTEVYANHKISVTFGTGPQHTITASAGANGTIAPSGAVKVSSGTDKTFTFTPDAGYKIEDVKVDDVSKGAIATYTFANVTADHKIHVTFTGGVTYKITVTSGPNGKVMYNGAAVTGDVVVNQNATPVFAFTPDTGFVVDDVVVDGASWGSLSNFTFDPVNQNHSVSVTFRPIILVEHTITATAGPNGKINPSGAVKVKEGNDQKFTFTPDDATKYEVADVLVDGVSVGVRADYTFTAVAKPHTISVTFKQKGVIEYRTITASAGAGGQISPSGAVKIEYGKNQSFAIIPNSGYLIENVVVDGVSKGAVSSYTFTNVTADHTIQATFIKEPIVVYYNITASAGTNGTIYPSGTVEVASGNSQDFSFTPASGFVVSDVVVDGTSRGALPSFTFYNVTGPHTIAVSFVPQEPVFIITASVTAGEGGTISPAGEVKVVKGASQTFTFSPASGYQILDVVVDNESKGKITTHTFQNVTGPHTIRATFGKIPLSFTITASAGANGTISPVGPVKVDAGASKTFAVTPDAGYAVDQVMVDNVQKTLTDGKYTFENVQATHTIHVTFIVVPEYTITASAGANGSINPSGAVKVKAGSSKTFYMVANKDYEIADVTVDNKSVSAVPVYTFENVTGNHTIGVTFKLTAVQRPDTPVLVSPCSETSVSLTPTLKGGPFSPADTDIHSWSEFQISEKSDFIKILHSSLKNTAPLTSLVVPDFFLMEGVEYFWRVRYGNVRGIASEWSKSCSFKTLDQFWTDQYSVRVPVSKKVEANDRDKYFPNVDISGASLAKTADLKKAIAVKGIGNAKLTQLNSVDARDVDAPSGVNMLDLAIFTLKIEPCNAGTKTAQVDYYLSEPVPTGVEALWYQYNPETGNMDEYQPVKPATMPLPAGTRVVTLQFEDGGVYDLDGAVNCEIKLGPSGLGVSTVGKAKPFKVTGTGMTATFDASDSTGQCFVWDFGDGSTDLSCQTTGGPHKVIEHKYAQKGTYDVTLMAMGTNGTETTAPVKVTVPFAAGEEGGGGDNCFISAAAYDSGSSMNLGFALMFIALAGACVSLLKVRK